MKNENAATISAEPGALGRPASPSAREAPHVRRLAMQPLILTPLQSKVDGRSSLRELGGDPAESVGETFPSVWDCDPHEARRGGGIKPGAAAPGS